MIDHDDHAARRRDEPDDQDAHRCLIITPGTCSECGCTDERACVDEETGARCYWADEFRTLCSACV